MGRKQMRNLVTYKIVDTQVNEFEYQKHQGEMTEQEDQHPDAIVSGSKPPTQAERVKQITAAAHNKVEKKRKKEGVKAGGSPKKSVTKPASKGAPGSKARKPAAAKATGKRKAAKKAPSRRSLSAVATKTSRKK